MAEGLAGRLQHPRRSLGDRHRSQAIKFLSLAEKDPDRGAANINWAEQNARQALLHDFTSGDNWRCLSHIKKLRGDESGLRVLMQDLFSVLGRDPEQIAQLDGVAILEVSSELLEAAFANDSLNIDDWWSGIESNDANLAVFIERAGRLDLSDPRCNVLFGRRLEKMRAAGHEESFVPLARRLLAQRPVNHELWGDLGRLHERKEDHDEAWFCYDQAQTHYPEGRLRDQFRERMKARLDDGVRKPWTPPAIDARDEFLSRMQSLAVRIGEPDDSETSDTEVEEEEVVITDIDRIAILLESGENSAAFFLARRVVAAGDESAREWLDKASEALAADDEIHIP
jgi:hypothetical protein